VQRIAVIDDGAVTLEIYKKILSRIEGTETTTFTSGEAGLEWCRENHPALIIVDYRTPDLDGIEFVGRYRKLAGRDGAAIIMSTTSSDRDVRQRALEIGTDDFLDKPGDAFEIFARARNLIELRRHTHSRGAATIDREAETIHCLTAIGEYRDGGTPNHVRRMGGYARLLAEKLGLSPEMQELLSLAAPMHDVGKVAIPDAILNKPAPLSPQEWEIMSKHAQIGHDILHGSSSALLQVASKIALTHHERYDGTGYPNGLLGGSIPIAGRIAAVIDAFDAMVSERPYKEAWPLPKALEMLQRGRGNRFDPDVIDAFLELIPQIDRLRERYPNPAS
jgi:response regulator RpfG family c-di-GMP phosphodiesterase